MGNYGWRWQLGCPCCEDEAHYVYAVGTDRGGSGAPVLLWIQYVIDGSSSVPGGAINSSQLRSVDVDPDGNWYTGPTLGTAVGVVYKFDSDNNLILTTDSTTHGAAQSISVNDAGEIAFVTLNTANGWTGVFESDGTLRWVEEFDNANASLTRHARDVQWLPDGNVAFCGVDTNIVLAVKDPSDGSILDTIAASTVELTSASTFSVDASGNIHLFGFGGAIGTTPRLAKYNSSLSLQWVANPSLLLPGELPPVLGLDPSGNVYAPGRRSNDSSVILEKFNSSGTSQWTIASNEFSTKLSLNGAICDSTGRLFVSGRTHTLGDGTNDLQGAILGLSPTDGSVVWSGSPLSDFQQLVGIVTTLRRSQWWT